MAIRIHRLLGRMAVWSGFDSRRLTHTAVSFLICRSRVFTCAAELARGHGSQQQPLAHAKHPGDVQSGPSDLIPAASLRNRDCRTLWVLTQQTAMLGFCFWPIDAHLQEAPSNEAQFIHFFFFDMILAGYNVNEID